MEKLYQIGGLLHGLDLVVLRQSILVLFSAYWLASQICGRNLLAVYAPMESLWRPDELEAAGRKTQER
jgi:hypothetical protein